MGACTFSPTTDHPIGLPHQCPSLFSQPPASPLARGCRGGVGERDGGGRAVYVHAYIFVYGCVWELAMPLDNKYQRIGRIPADILEYSINRRAWRFPETAIHLKITYAHSAIGGGSGSFKTTHLSRAEASPFFGQLTIEDIEEGQLAIGDRSVPPSSDDPPPTEDTAMEDRGSGGRDVRARIS